MYLPKFKYESSKFTSGGEYIVKATGEEYKGFYFVTYKGEVYSGAEPSLRDTNLQLLPFRDEQLYSTTPGGEDLLIYDEIYNSPHEASLKSTEEVPSHVPVVTVGDAIDGFFLRYFAQNKITKQIIEINKQTYSDLDNKTVRFFYKNYNIVRLYWFLSGEIEDTQSGPYKIPGIRTKNSESIKTAEKTVPGLSQYLQNLLEFVE